MEFSLCLLFAKLVSYTFLYWLPLYIVNVGELLEMAEQSRVDSAPPHLASHPAPLPAAHFGAKEAGDLSTLFDVGGILGLWCAWVQAWINPWGQSGVSLTQAHLSLRENIFWSGELSVGAEKPCAGSQLTDK